MTRRAFVRAGLAIVAMLASPAAAADRDAARGAMAEGIAAFNSGNAHTARARLQAAIAADPDWALPRAVQARVLLTLEDGAGAQTEINRASSLGMPDNQLRHLAAHAALLEGNPKRALSLSAPDGLPPTSAAYASRIAARAALALGDFALARVRFDTARRLAPRSAQLWVDIGRFERDNGNLAGAYGAARTAVSLGPRNIDALMLMGEMTRTRIGLIAAITWFERARAADPANIAALGELAATLGDAGQASAMLAITREMIAIEPENPRAFYLQAVLAARAADYGLARSLMYHTKGRLDDVPAVMLLQSVLDIHADNAEAAIARLIDLVNAQPANMRARSLLGAAMARAGDDQSAIGVLARIAVRDDADSYTLLLFARAHEAMGDREAAAVYLDRAAAPVRGDPTAFETGAMALASARGQNSDNADVAIPRMAWLINNGGAGEALGLADRLAALNPGAPGAKVAVGDVYMALGRPRDAAAAYGQAGAIAASEPIILRLIDALAKAGDEQAATTVLNRFLQQNPRNIAALRLAADRLLAAQSWDNASAVLESLRARLGNRDALLLGNLGWASLNRNDRAAALRYTRAAYWLAPANPALANGYGWALFTAGTDRAAALMLLDKASTIAPQHPGLAFQFAQALLAAGQKAAARAPLTVAAASADFPDHAEAARLLAGL